MIIERPSFPSPVLVIDDFLPKDQADACFEEAIDLKRIYMPSRVGYGQDNRTDPKIRTNELVYLDSVFGSAPERSRILTALHNRVNSEECKAVFHKGDLIFDVINYANRREMTLSRYGAGNHYGKHQDTVFAKENPDAIRHRLATMCYYMNREPQRFTGGALALYKNEETLTVEPKHNRAVLFPSFTHHEVQAVKLEDKEFDSGRFSVNFWFGFK